FRTGTKIAPSRFERQDDVITVAESSSSTVYSYRYQPGRTRAMASADQVLVVSSFDARDMYVEYFQASGFTAVGAANPTEALTLVRGSPPAVVVTDIIFLDFPSDSTPFLRELRSHLDDSTSIIVVSGRVREEDRQNARGAGADFYLIKPALPADVLHDVKRALMLRRSGQRLSWNWVPSLAPLPTV